MRSSEANYTALLMSTGLTFSASPPSSGSRTRSSNQKQYSLLVTVVILSAFVPTILAQRFFQPSVRTMVAWGRLYKRRLDPDEPNSTSKG